jgi:hypothetical protein
MTDWIALCEEISAAAFNRVYPSADYAHFIGIALEAAAAELRRQRDAAQESGEEGREGASWAATTNGADSSHAAASDQRALSPASICESANALERVCSDCAWWHFLARERSARAAGYGECRLSSPGRDGWPVSKPGEWCGDFYARAVDTVKREHGG